MTVIQFAGNGEGHNNNGPPLQDASNNISKPTKRQRWATQRLEASGGIKKRLSIMGRLHRRVGSIGEKRASTGSAISQRRFDSAGNPSRQANEEDAEPPRRIYFNLSVPESERDEEGNLKARYPRNKIRTSKYTALTFIPKNLWLQFHNIANIYFLFVIVLQASLQLHVRYGAIPRVGKLTLGST